MKVTRETVASQGRIARAALENEQLTRVRVKRLEDLLERGFWGRFKWLFLGR